MNEFAFFLNKCFPLELNLKTHKTSMQMSGIEIPTYFNENLRGSCVANGQFKPYLAFKLLLSSGDGCVPGISHQGILPFKSI